MPLDHPNKIAHVSAALQRTWTGRTKTVVFVYNTNGTYNSVAQTVIFRKQQVIDPQLPNLTGSAPGVPADVLMICPISTNLTGVVYIADTATATSSAVAAAAKYEIIEAVPTGMVPGGTRYVVELRRLR
jgi:hypothetical protein